MKFLSMYCPEELKVNRHRVVLIPDGKDVFGRVGRPDIPASLYSGDETPTTGLSKTEELAATEQRLYEEYAKSQNSAKDDE